MKTTSTVHVNIKLEMDLNDARWLQAVMQNPLHHCDPNDEDNNERKRRIALFTALKDQTDNHGG